MPKHVKKTNKKYMFGNILKQLFISEGRQMEEK